VNQRRTGRTVLVALVGVIGLCAVTLVVVGPRTLVDRVTTALGGVTCDDERCPADAPWVYPVDAAVTSGFRTDARPDHHGVDLAAPYDTPVVAASAGVVTISECQASLDGAPYGCDQDGSAEVRGCGWFVKILHAHHTATLYCHLRYAPEVSVGDVVSTGDPLGYVGSSGNSSEPHLHFEVQVGDAFRPPVSATAVDPEPFLAARVTG